MQIKVDLTNAEDNFEPIPAGIYEAVVSNVELRDSKTTEWQYLNIELTIVAGEYANRKVWMNLSLSPKAAWKLKQALKAFGFPEEKLAGQVVFDPQDFVGASCIVEVIQTANPRTNVLRNEVKGVYPAKSPIPTSTPVTTPNAAKTATATPKKTIPNIK